MIEYTRLLIRLPTPLCYKGLALGGIVISLRYPSPPRFAEGGDCR
jgi:hypothetical protein